MNRPFTAHSPYSLTPTERIRSPRDDSSGAADDLQYDTPYEDFEESAESADHGDYADDYEDYDDYQPIDRRWVWVAGVAGAILLVAVICTVVILGGGDSGSVSSTTAAPPITTTQPAATTSAPPVAPTPSPSASLPPETVTTVTPTPSATASATESAPPIAPPIAAPTDAAPAPRTVTYRVFGSRPLLDLVTVIYTDQQGALQTELNVALPWTKTVVLDPGVELTSVTGTSVTGQLNCSITDASGALVTEQNTNSIITACTK